VNAAEEMCAAAQRLRTRAAAATRGPWHCGPAIDGLKDVYGPDNQHVSGGDWPVAVIGDSEWMALMSPEVADELARILDATASVVYMTQCLNTEHYAVLDFARLVNRKVVTPRAAQEAQ
jgi:hypothetical protein